MKRIVILLLIFCCLFIAGIYLFIPAVIPFSDVQFIKTKLSITDRLINDAGKWFPKNTNPSNDSLNTYCYKDYCYRFEKKMMNVAEVSISNNQIMLQSQITMISANSDSVAIEWKSSLNAGNDPVSRIKNYIKAREIKNDIHEILNHLKIFLEKNDNVYSMHLYEIFSKDSTLVATRFSSHTFPSVTELYKSIDSLHQYISAEHAKENNCPMMHVEKINDTLFETMVAIPVDRLLQGNGTIFLKRFVPWKMLAADVKGGDYTVTEALNQMSNYIADYQLRAMAIPYASLVTDRRQQPDTLQWITRIYTPIP